MIFSLIGNLSHAAKIITPGRIFLRRMIDVAHRVKHLNHWVHLNHEFKSDLAWWQTFVDTWDGLGMMKSVAANWTPRFTFSTDASGSWGCGACWGDKWIQCAWNGMWQDVSIATTELLPILLAVAMWGVFWWGNQVLVQCDNMAIVQIIATNTSTDPVIIHLLRRLHFFSAYYNIIWEQCISQVVSTFVLMPYLATSYRFSTGRTLMQEDTLHRSRIAYGRSWSETSQIGDQGFGEDRWPPH